MDEIKEWVKKQNLNFEIEKINIHEVGEERYRVDVYSAHMGSFMRILIISESYYLQKTDSGITDLTIRSPFGYRMSKLI